MTVSQSVAIVDLTSEVVRAYFERNHLGLSELHELIASVHATLVILSRPQAQASAPVKLVPPVSIKKSVTDGYLISLEDGKRYQSLKRHLTTRGLTPDQYRVKWGLPNDYPMDAPAYTVRRSEMAKKRGLGRARQVALQRMK